MNIINHSGELIGSSSLKRKLFFKMLIRAASATKLVSVLLVLFVSSYNVIVSASGSSFSLTRKKHLQAVVKEVDALLKWKSSLINQISLLSSWKISSNASTTSPCEWYGITCNNQGSVAELSLPDLDLQGFLPQNICQSGTLDASIKHFRGPIPRSLRNCTSLKSFGIGNNQLVDNITEAFHVYPYLEWFVMENNSLYGELSKEWPKFGSPFFLKEQYHWKNTT
ncbi:leucine-rich repeat protein 1-like [Papaver somniferum]|uniref:leucine-rich repeat protein 1-like n=1 Tax=Papaver somniferum TaxID=3469 RepID=UPI000E703B44|nr:leucine-rich repeat protein 1-like [Papaver somniferum]